MAITKETIGERLSARRTELARVEATIERQEKNGRSWAIGGSSVTEISYERALRRRQELRREIRRLEDRVNGTNSTPGLARTRTRMD